MTKQPEQLWVKKNVQKEITQDKGIATICRFLSIKSKNKKQKKVLFSFHFINTEYTALC